VKNRISDQDPELVVIKFRITDPEQDLEIEICNLDMDLSERGIE
jgi:hypothetical protein